MSKSKSTPKYFPVFYRDPSSQKYLDMADDLGRSAFMTLVQLKCELGLADNHRLPYDEKTTRHFARRFGVDAAEIQAVIEYGEIFQIVVTQGGERFLTSAEFVDDDMSYYYDNVFQGTKESLVGKQKCPAATVEAMDREEVMATSAAIRDGKYGSYQKYMEAMEIKEKLTPPNPRVKPVPTPCETRANPVPPIESESNPIEYNLTQSESESEKGKPITDTDKGKTIKKASIEKISYPDDFEEFYVSTGCLLMYKAEAFAEWVLLNKTQKKSALKYWGARVDKIMADNPTADDARLKYLISSASAYLKNSRWTQVTQGTHNNSKKDNRAENIKLANEEIALLCKVIENNTGEAFVNPSDDHRVEMLKLLTEVRVEVVREGLDMEELLQLVVGGVYEAYAGEPFTVARALQMLYKKSIEMRNIKHAEKLANEAA